MTISKDTSRVNTRETIHLPSGSEALVAGAIRNKSR